MPMEIDFMRVWAWLRAGRKGDAPSDPLLGTALGVAETVAKRHGGEVRIRSRGDGGVFVELRFPIAAPPA
jgi:signal transduction histidine kinase